MGIKISTSWFALLFDNRLLLNYMVSVEVNQLAVQTGIPGDCFGKTPVDLGHIASKCRSCKS